MPFFGMGIVRGIAVGKLCILFVFNIHESLGGNQHKTSLAYPPTKSLFRISYLEIIRPKACKDVRLEPAFSVGAVAGIVRNKCALWKHNPRGLFRPAHSPMEPKPPRSVFQRHSDFPRDALIGAVQPMTSLSDSGLRPRHLGCSFSSWAILVRIIRR